MWRGLILFLAKGNGAFLPLLSMIFILLAVDGFSDLGTETLYLTWESHPETTMTVQWITGTDQQRSVVYLRPLGEPCPWIKIEGRVLKFPFAADYLIHRVTMKNLKPGGAHVFMVEGSDQEFRFHTLSENLPEEGLTFVEGGDMYHDGIDIMEKVSRQAALTEPAFALIGGDIAYTVPGYSPFHPQKIDRWIEWIKSWHATMVTPKGYLIPVIAAIGNHDLIGQYGQTPKEAAIFSALFPLAGGQIYTVFDVGTYLSIFLLDTGHANPIAGKQTAWLKEALAQRADRLYRLAAYHVPAYPSVRRYYNSSSSAIRSYWVPLFEKGGIQTVFEHHDHAYKRTFPLLRNKFNPKGIVYIGDGGWGVEVPRKPRSNVRRHFLEKFVASRNFIEVKLTPTMVLIRSINDKGEVIDTYQKRRGL
jgi:acid phosphatase type 7